MIERFARPYADALFSVADSTDDVAAIRRELGGFAQAMADAPSLGQMVANPGIPREAKEATLQELAGKMGLGRITSNLLETLLRNQRLPQLGAVLDAIDDRLDRSLGIMRATVTSASQLSGDQEARLKELLESKLGAKVEIDVTVDASLLGGFVAQIGSDRYDVSLKGELDRMASHLAGSAEEAAAS